MCIDYVYGTVVTKVLCYIITRDVNKAEFNTYYDVNIECYDIIVIILLRNFLNLVFLSIQNLS